MYMLWRSSINTPKRHRTFELCSHCLLIAFDYYRLLSAWGFALAIRDNYLFCEHWPGDLGAFITYTSHGTNSLREFLGTGKIRI